MAWLMPAKGEERRPVRGRFPGLTNQIMMQRPFLSALAIAALMGVLAPADAQAQALLGADFIGHCFDTRFNRLLFFGLRHRPEFIG